MKLPASLFLGLLLSVSPVRANEPFKLDALLHSLLQVQDRIAEGDDAALPLQKHIMGLLEAAIDEAGSPDTMSEESVRALLIFGIIGTSKSVLTETLSDKRLPEKYSKLAMAIGTYRKRQRQQALKRFAEIPTSEIDIRLRPYVAFAKGNLMAKRRPVKAEFEYNIIRLEAPGTLLEEATLRRLLSLYLEHDQGQKFTRIAKEYGQRFINSPYREQYLKIIRRGVVKLRRTMTLDDIKSITKSMPPVFQASMYMHLVRSSLTSGHMKLAALAIEEIIALAKKSEDVRIEENQLKVLKLLSKMNSGEPLQLYAEMRQIDRRSLHVDDEKLLRTAEAILESIVGPIDSMGTNSVTRSNAGEEQTPKEMPEPEAQQVSPAQTESAIVEADKKFNAIERFIEDAEGRLANIDDLLSD